MQLIFKKLLPLSLNIQTIFFKFIYDKHGAHRTIEQEEIFNIPALTERKRGSLNLSHKETIMAAVPKTTTSTK